jgi:NADH dehydrogenase FAD-containing subunit
VHYWKKSEVKSRPCQLSVLFVIKSDLSFDEQFPSQTAQVASQQGKYLAKKLQKLARQRSVLEANELPENTDEAVSPPFRYAHLGSLAYIGNAAVFDMGNLSFMGGLVAMYAWRSIYWSEQVSARTRAMLMIDWIIRYDFIR